MEEVDFAVERIRDTGEDLLGDSPDDEPDIVLSQDEILDHLENTPFDRQLNLDVIKECLFTANGYMQLNEGVASVLGTIGNFLMKTGGAVGKVLTGPYGYLVASLGISAASALVKKMKAAAAARDKEKMDSIIKQANAEIAQAKNKPKSQPAQQQKTV